MKRLIEPDTNCIDIGCHFGSMLSGMMSRAPKGLHLAFEPTPLKAAFLRRKFPEVDVQEVALSDSEGTVTFWLNESSSGFNGLRQHGSGHFRSITVRQCRLDDVVPDGRRFGFVKIDVEGAELLVLRGAPELLRRDRPALLFECGPDGPTAFGFETADLHRELLGLGYVVHTTQGWLAGADPVDERAFVAGTQYPYVAFNWLAVAA
jgi:FkbM family methyltransferase